MDFSLSPEIENYRQRIHNFVKDEILPLERDPENFDAHEMIEEDVLLDLRTKAKKQGLWAFQMPDDSEIQPVSDVILHLHRGTAGRKLT